MKIGFIGLGIMGRPMAARLIRNGYDLVVHNRTREKAEPLIEQGATWAGSPAEVGRQAELLFTMLADPAAVRQVAQGEQGFLDQLQPGSLWVDCSTVNPSFSREMAAESQSQGVRFLDAPVGGSWRQAEKGELSFFVGGEASDVEASRTIFELLGKKVVHVGSSGLGTGLKMVYNLLLAQAMVAFSEGMLLGQSLGISQDLLFEVLLDAPVTAPSMAGKRRNIETGNFPVNFPIRWMQKDLQLISQTGYEQSLTLPATNLVKEVYALAKNAGLAEADYSAIYKFLAGE